jgi:FKBP-type peptidyl-prolyl cis-trans isomerase
MRLLVKKITILFIGIFSLFIVSCGNNKFPGFKTTESGVNIKYHFKAEESEKPVLNSVVTVKMNYRLEDSVLFESSSIEDPLRFPIIEPTFKGDLYAALMQLNIGDSVSVAFPADSFFMVTAGLEKLPDFVVPGSPMFFDIKLTEIQSEEDVKAEQVAMMKMMKEQEQMLLKQYLDERKITVTPKQSGLYVIEEKSGSGSLPKVGEMLQLHFNITTIDGMELYSTKDQSPMDIEYGKAFDTKGFDEGIGYIRKGGSSTLIVPSHLAFDSAGRGQFVAPYTTLIYQIQLLNIRTVAEVEKERTAKAKVEENAAEKARVEEPKRIQDYLKQQNITIAPLASGLYFLESLKGSGIKADSGKNVTVHYTLYTIDGKKLQSSVEMGQPFTFKLGQNNVIKGWDEALSMMHEGGKAKLIIPSSLAYGANDKGPDMPAYSTLVFEIELIKVGD